MNKKIKLQNRIILYGMVITIIPLIFSYMYFLNNKLDSIDERIRVKLKEVGYIVSSNEFVQEKIYEGKFDYGVQEYTKELIKNISDVDIIVITDMDARKYAHPDEEQLKTVYVNDDNKKVIEDGSSYYSVMVGSMGKTLRWFEPIYYEDTQIGFVMVGKYYDDIVFVNNKVKVEYALLFLISFLICAIMCKLLSNGIKKEILGMEPENIAGLYLENKAIIDNVQDGIITLDENMNIKNTNKKCSEILNNSPIETVIDKIKKYVKNRADIKMKEIIVNDMKIFVTINTIKENGKYLGCIVLLNEGTSINRVAKEITGVDEIVKNLRASVHEFKNHLHVIMGLIQMEQYSTASEYILKIQKMQEFTTIRFSTIKDAYVRSILVSREIIAKEKKVCFRMTDDSCLNEDHGIIDSVDIVTILGNLIENALECCAMMGNHNGVVTVSVLEDDDKIVMEVNDNGIKIDPLVKNTMFEMGISTKGDSRGTGLALVANRVELYNGRIDVEESDKDKTFIVTLYKGECI